MTRWLLLDRLVPVLTAFTHRAYIMFAQFLNVIWFFRFSSSNDMSAVDLVPSVIDQSLQDDANMEFWAQFMQGNLLLDAVLAIEILATEISQPVYSYVFSNKIKFIKNELGTMNVRRMYDTLWTYDNHVLAWCYSSQGWDISPIGTVAM